MNEGSSLTLEKLYRTFREFTLSMAIEEMHWAQAGLCVCKPCVIARRSREWHEAMGTFSSTIDNEDCLYGRWRWNDPRRP